MFKLCGAAIIYAPADCGGMEVFMENLYIDTPSGRLQIEARITKKYHLEKGLLSPFTRQPVTDEKGRFPACTDTENNPENNGAAQMHDMDEEDTILSTSEAIDFAQAADTSSGK